MSQEQNPSTSHGNGFHRKHARIVHTNTHGDGYISEELYERGEYFVAGGLASMTSRTLTAPIDRLKIYLISETYAKRPTWQYIKKGHLMKAATAAGDGLLTASRNIWNAGGVRSLWAGNGLNIEKMLPEGAIKFGVYETSRRFFAAWEGVESPANISVWAQTASGGMGGVAAQFAAYPLDTLRFRIQCNMQKDGFQGQRLLSDTAKQMWRAGGIRPFFRGLLWGLVGQYPYSAIDLTLYEYTRRWWTAKNESKGLSEGDARLGAVGTAVIGGFSGAVGASAVWPLNLLRTRLQTSGTSVNPRRYDGIVDVARQTIVEEGWRGLWKGMAPNLIKVIPSVAITYVVYDKSKQALELHQ